MEIKSIYDGYGVSRCGVVFGKRGNPMAPSDNGRGYPIVSVVVDGKRTSKTLHRAVAEAWIPNPEGLSDVNHKDNDRWNCHADNLEWCTHGANIAYSYASSNRTAVGTSNARCTTTEAEVREICRLLACGMTAAEVRDAGYSYSRVRAIKAGKNWSHIAKEYNV